MSCDYCWPGNCCGGPNCLTTATGGAQAGEHYDGPDDTPGICTSCGLRPPYTACNTAGCPHDRHAAQRGQSAAKSDEEAAREIKPFSYAYLYPWFDGKTAVSHDPGPVNGGYPIETIPLYDAAALAQARAEGKREGMEEERKRLLSEIADKSPAIAAAIREAKP